MIPQGVVTSNGERTEGTNQGFNWNLGFMQMLFGMKDLLVLLFMTWKKH